MPAAFASRFGIRSKDAEATPSVCFPHRACTDNPKLKETKTFGDPTRKRKKNSKPSRRSGPCCTKPKHVLNRASKRLPTRKDRTTESDVRITETRSPFTRLHGTRMKDLDVRNADTVQPDGSSSQGARWLARIRLYLEHLSFPSSL